MSDHQSTNAALRNNSTLKVLCSTMAVRPSLSLLAGSLLLLPALVQSFLPSSSLPSFFFLTHRDITQKAILRKTAEVCRDIAASEGRSFSLAIDDTLSVNKVHRACSDLSSISTISTEMFQAAINSIHNSNDAPLTPDPAFHFYNEAIRTGRDLITEGLSALKASVKEQNFQSARNTLGRICHTLQDFYSESNWVELGRTTPYSILIRPDQPLENLAGPDVPTCSSCAEICRDNILPEVLERGLLTSGYYGVESPVKPAGKCSHGGLYDRTSRTEPTGGINKDTVWSSHGQFHQKAADLAVEATVDLLEDIRLAIGDRTFLRFLDLSLAPAFVFVVDTTGSMSDDIADVKNKTAQIIDERRGTPNEPFEYILVPFNDPEFGPVTRTTDADIMKSVINNLTPNGGGDAPEMSLSGLRLALTAAPPSSFIFFFTDAGAKDTHLKNSVIALFETTKTKFYAFITNVLARRRRRAILPQNQLYHDLAQVSGGLAIEVSKSKISLATTIIEPLTAGAVVTVLHVTEDPGRPKNFTFLVDTTLSNMLIYVTGASSLTFTLTSSSAVSQRSNESSGPLASISLVGNLWQISLNTENQTGQWEIMVNSSSPYTVKVTGQSSLNFIYNLVEPQEGTNGSVIPKEGRPTTGGNITLLVTITGSDTVTVREVTLFDSSRSTQVIGSIQAIGNNNFLVGFREVPGGSYLVQLMGDDINSASRSSLTSFQRQASTQIRTSTLSITAQADRISIEPGSNISVLFTVYSEVSGSFTVQANNDRSFPSTSTNTVSIVAGDGGQANGTVILTAPTDTASGTDVSLTIDVQNAAGTDINYTVLRFSVAAKVADLSAPVCEILRILGVCPASPLLCASVQWELYATFTDGINGTGIASISQSKGNGTFDTNTTTGIGGENVTVVVYRSTCCSQSVQLAAVDRVGNVGTCEGNAIALTTPAPSTTPSLTTPSLTTPSLEITTNISVSTTVFQTVGTTHSTSAGAELVFMSHCIFIAAVICSFQALFYN